MIDIKSILSKPETVVPERVQDKFKLMKMMVSYFKISLLQARNLVEAIEKETTIQ